MIGNLLKIFRTVVIVLVGVYLANKYNIFDYISFIPEENSYDLCITTYISILEIFRSFLAEYINNKYMSELTVILSLKKDTEIYLESNPIIEPDGLDLAEAFLTIRINGRKEHFKNSQIKIPATEFATMQASLRDKEAKVDNDGNYIVELEKLFGSTDMKIMSSSLFTISFVKEPFETKRTIEIIPEFERNTSHKKSFFVKYKCNKALLKVGG